MAVFVAVVHVRKRQRVPVVAGEFARLLLVVIRFVRPVIAILFAVVNRRQGDRLSRIQARIRRCLRLRDRIVRRFVVATGAVVLSVVDRGERYGVA